MMGRLNAGRLGGGGAWATTRPTRGHSIHPSIHLSSLIASRSSTAPLMCSTTQLHSGTGGRAPNWLQVGNFYSGGKDCLFLASFLGDTRKLGLGWFMPCFAQLHRPVSVSSRGRSVWSGLVWLGWLAIAADGKRVFATERRRLRDPGPGDFSVDQWSP